MKICAKVSNQCSSGEQRSVSVASAGHQVRCQTLHAVLSEVFHFWCQSLGVSGVPRLLEDAICRVLKSGAMGWFKVEFAPSGKEL